MPHYPNHKAPNKAKPKKKPAKKPMEKKPAKGLTEKQKKLPKGLQQAILKSKNKKKK